MGEMNGINSELSVAQMNGSVDGSSGQSEWEKGKKEWDKGDKTEIVKEMSGRKKGDRNMYNGLVFINP